MKYAGMIKQSLVDYPGKISTIIFTWGCNFRCPFCHNGDLLLASNKPSNQIDIEEILEFLQKRKGFIDAVVISGGEPTLHEELMEDIRRIKQLSYLVKLDTNGSNPVLLEHLLEEELLDYVAMDIKAPMDYDKYRQASGILTSRNYFNIKNSIQILQKSNIKVEFRTTVVPILHTFEDIINIAKYIQGAERYTLQQFNPLFTLEAGYAKIVPYSREEMKEIAGMCAEYVKKVQVVNV